MSDQLISSLLPKLAYIVKEKDRFLVAIIVCRTYDRKGNYTAKVTQFISALD